jgi:hypothetical protein
MPSESHWRALRFTLRLTAGAFRVTPRGLLSGEQGMITDTTIRFRAEEVQDAVCLPRRL